MGTKELCWLGSAQKDLPRFPQVVCERIGSDLEAIQYGDRPSSLKYLSGVGAGEVELKIKHIARAFRVIFVRTLPELIFILHAFEKKSQKTSCLDIETARRRYRKMKRTYQ